MNPLLLSDILSNNGFTSIICYRYHNHKVIACFLSYRLFANLVSHLGCVCVCVCVCVCISFYLKIHDSLYFSCLQSLLNHNRALIPTVTTPIFLAIYWKFSGNFFFQYTGSTKISTKISAVSPILVGPKLSTYTLFTLLISHIS